MVQPESLKNGFGVFGQGFVLFVAFLRVRELEQLNFLELVLAEDAPGILSRGPGFRTETSRPRGEV